MIQSSISFRPLTRADFPDMLRWWRAPHAARWFGPYEPDDLRGCEAVYGPSIDGTDPARVHILEIDGRSGGYLQHYLVRDEPVYLAAVGDDQAAGIDFIIGEDDLIGKGLGPLVIAEYVRTIVVAAYPWIRRVVSSPDADNGRSIRALEKAGFQQGALIHVDGQDRPERLCALDVPSSQFQPAVPG